MDNSQKDELAKIVSFESIASNKPAIKQTVNFLTKKLGTIGFKVEIVNTPGVNPIIIAEIGSGKKTINIYNHYDVQPAEEPELWTGSPFQLSESNGKLIARGIADNKGNLMSRIHAIEELLKDGIKLKNKIRFIIEGEEEIGSPGLVKFSEDYESILKDADLCVWEMGKIGPKGNPVMVLCMKGILYVEVTTTIGELDLHSAKASLFDSAIWKHLEVLNSIRSEQGDILVPGINELIEKPSTEEYALLDRLAENKKFLLESNGRENFINSADQRTAFASLYFKPTANICGINGGFNQPGKIKTVLPKTITSKIDFRLVAGMDPEKVLELLEKHLSNKGFTHTKINKLIAVPVGKTDMSNEAFQKGLAIIKSSYKKEVDLQMTTGGTGPYYYLASKFNVPVINFGCGHEGSNEHAPNENIFINDYDAAKSAMKELVQEFE